MKIMIWSSSHPISQVGGDDVLHGLDIARVLGGKAYQPYRKHRPPRVPQIRVEPGVEPHFPR
jgi:hypothetical protein